MARFLASRCSFRDTPAASNVLRLRERLYELQLRNCAAARHPFLEEDRPGSPGRLLWVQMVRQNHGGGAHDEHCGIETCRLEHLRLLDDEFFLPAYVAATADSRCADHHKMF